MERDSTMRRCGRAVRSATGILGNAELLLTRKDRLSAIETQRLQTVVDLAVRLRETIRRVSNSWENHLHAAKSA